MGYNSKYTGSEVEYLLDKIKNLKEGGGGNADLSQYVTLAKLEEDLRTKVNKEEGKGLSTEDFTTELKNKLNSFENCDIAELTDALTTLRNDLDSLVSGDTTTAIKTFNEVIAFLEGLSDTEELSSIIASIEQQIADKQDNIEDLDTIREEASKVPTILGEDGYVYSNGEKVDMRFTRSLLPFGTSIPAKANLNTIEYLKIGKYYCSLNVDAKTITNCPVSEAFSMEVFNPLGVNVDDETTANYTYRLRVLTLYSTGQQYIQYCSTNGTPGVWTYASWYIGPRTVCALKSSKNGSTCTVGGTTRGIYLNSTGELKQMSYTISKSVPSTAVFTDTKVTSAANHYTPAEDTSQVIQAPEGSVISSLQRDAAGHIVGAAYTPLSASPIVFFEVNRLEGNVGDVIFETDKQDIEEGINSFIEAIKSPSKKACLYIDDIPCGHAIVSSIWYDNSLLYTPYRFGYVYNGHVYEVELEDGPNTIFTIIGKMKIVGDDPTEVVVDDTNLVIFSDTSDNGVLKSNRKYIVTESISGIQIISSETPTDLSAEYIVHFSTGDTLGESSFPSDWYWVNGVVPTLEVSTAYELSVVASKVGDSYIYKSVLAAFKRG